MLSSGWERHRGAWYHAGRTRWAVSSLVPADNARAQPPPPPPQGPGTGAGGSFVPVSLSQDVPVTFPLRESGDLPKEFGVPALEPASQPRGEEEEEEGSVPVPPCPPPRASSPRLVTTRGESGRVCVSAGTGCSRSAAAGMTLAQGLAV